MGIFNVGKQLFTTAGPEGLRRLSRYGVKIFLDLKFQDIPNTVAGAVRAAVELPGAGLLNVHALGGRLREKMKKRRRRTEAQGVPEAEQSIMLRSEPRLEERRTG